MAEIQNLRSRIEQAAVDLRNLGATEKGESLLKAHHPCSPARQDGEGNDQQFSLRTLAHRSSSPGHVTHHAKSGHQHNAWLPQDPRSSEP